MKMIKSKKLIKSKPTEKKANFSVMYCYKGKKRI